jgi:hypothetical protein
MHVALRGQIIDLGRRGVLDDADQRRGVRHVSEMEKETNPVLVAINIKVVDAFGIERRRTALDAVNDISLIEDIPLGRHRPGR